MISVVKIVRMVSSGDLKIFHFINDSIKCKALDRLLPFLTHLGGAIITTLTCIMLMLSKKSELVSSGYKSAAALLSSHIFIHYLKKIINRPRPFLKLNGVNTFKTDLKDYSFPSGHTTAAFSICVSLALSFPAMWMALVILAFIIGLSRIYIGVHYPTDVFIGMIVGTTFAIMSNSLVEGYIVNRLISL